MLWLGDLKLYFYMRSAARAPIPPPARPGREDVVRAKEGLCGSPVLRATTGADPTCQAASRAETIELMSLPDGRASQHPDPAAIEDEDTLAPTASLPPPAPAEREGSGRISRLSLAEVRRTLASLPIFEPRWRPWTPLRALEAVLAFAAAMALLVVVTHRVTKRWAPWSAAPPAEGEELVFPLVITGRADRAARADQALSRDHRSLISGGLLIIPPAFRSPDGVYDLVIHFHGNTELVEESYRVAGLDAVVLTLNLGVGSGVYEDRFANPMVLPEVLGRVQAAMEKRGLAEARLGRLALSAWSAGYGAVLKVLEQPALAAGVDAVILLDGLHIGYQPGSTELALEKLTPFVRFAEEAVAGRKLFSITHSNIRPMTTYAGAGETTDALLRAVGVAREPGGEAPSMPSLSSIEGVIAKKKLLSLTPESRASRGGLFVRGYEGELPEHHMAHLIQMSTTALPDLVRWWSATERPGRPGPI